MRIRCIQCAVGVAILVVAGVGVVYGSATGTVNVSVAGDEGSTAGLQVVIASSTDSRYTGRCTVSESGSCGLTDVPVGGFGVKVFDESQNLLAHAEGTIANEGQVVTLQMRVP
jgi:hypothetical protein